MKVILYMAISVNGYIAKEDNNVDWISNAQWVDYKKAVKRTKVAIVGRRTYDIMNEEEFFEGCRFYVLSHDKNLKPKFKNIICTTNSPKEVLSEIEGKGFKEVAIIGGGTLNSSFMKEGLIDEIILDIEPFVLGKGIPLFAQNNFEYQLELIEMKKLNVNTVQVRFKVIKS